MPNHFANLWDAIQKKETDKVKKLLKQTSTQKIINTKNKACLGYTPLMSAASMGQAEMVEALLAHGANHTIQDNHCLDNAASLAFKNHHHTIVEMIKEHGNFRPAEKIISTFFKKKISNNLVEIMLDYFKPTTHRAPKK